MNNRITLRFNKDRLLDVFIMVSTCSKYAGAKARPNLSKDEGLLISFEEPSFPMVWNKGVNYNISTLYIGKDMKILNIVEMTPNSQDIILCKQQVRYLLQIATPTRKSKGLKIGDQIEELIRN